MYRISYTSDIFKLEQRLSFVSMGQEGGWGRRWEGLGGGLAHGCRFLLVAAIGDSICPEVAIPEVSWRKKQALVEGAWLSLPCPVATRRWPWQPHRCPG